MPIFTPIGLFSKLQTAATISLTANATSGADATTYTFSGQSLGTAVSDRKILVGIAGGTSNRTVSSCTVGGVSATLVKRQQGAAQVTAELWIANVPTGTTGDVVVTWSGANDRMGIGVYRLLSSAASSTMGSNALTPTGTIDCPANGVIVGCVCQQGSAPLTFTWTGITEKYDETCEGNTTQSGAFDAFATAQTGRTITATPSGVALDAAMAVASFGPY